MCRLRRSGSAHALAANAGGGNPVPVGCGPATRGVKHTRQALFLWLWWCAEQTWHVQATCSESESLLALVRPAFWKLSHSDLCFLMNASMQRRSGLCFGWLLRPCRPPLPPLP